MPKITWDNSGEHVYETGISKGVLYPIQEGGAYSKGVAWNGLTAVTENPTGADATPLYADDIKYLSLTAAEEFGATIEAYTYPDEFGVCDGSAELKPGLLIGQQNRSLFGLCYRTTLGNDEEGGNFGYKLHLVYGAIAAPSSKGYKTINDKPEAITFSWAVTTTPVAVEGFKPTASVTIDSTKITPTALAAIEELLYGGTAEASLPLPDDIAALVTA